MTLGEGKRKVLMLLDEYSSGGRLTEDADIALKMNDFFDMAQKDVAQWQAIRREAEVALDGSGEQTLGADVGRVVRILRDGKRARRVSVVNGRLRYPAGMAGSVTVDYLAVPATIAQETEDTYVFEVSEEAANCLPFFVAAQQLIADLIIDHGAFYQIYLQMKGQLPRSAGDTFESWGGVRQALFGGGV